MVLETVFLFKYSGVRTDNLARRIRTPYPPDQVYRAFSGHSAQIICFYALQEQFLFANNREGLQCLSPHSSQSLQAHKYPILQYWCLQGEIVYGLLESQSPWGIDTFLFNINLDRQSAHPDLMYDVMSPAEAKLHYVLHGMRSMYREKNLCCFQNICQI